MKVFSIGEFCKHEGNGWSILVADNENAFTNIQKVLIDHHQSEIDRYKDLSDVNTWSKEIKGHQEIIDLVKNSKSILEFNHKEIPPWNQNVIRLDMQEILD